MIGLPTKSLLLLSLSSWKPTTHVVVSVAMVMTAQAYAIGDAAVTSQTTRMRETASAAAANSLHHNNLITNQILVF